MTERKKCESCKKPLIAFQHTYLHPDTPCSGIKDSINIEAEIMDDSSHEIFTEKYGTPLIDDYDLLLEYETIIEVQHQDITFKQSLIEKYEKYLNNKLIKIMVKVIDFFKSFKIVKD